MKTLNLILFFSLFALLSFGQSSYPKNYSWQSIDDQKAISDRVSMVIEKARYFYYMEEDWPSADSVIRVPLQWRISDQEIQRQYLLALGKYGDLEFGFEAIDLWFKEKSGFRSEEKEWWHLWIEIIQLEQLFNSEVGLKKVDELISWSEQFTDSTFKGVAYFEKARLHNIEKDKIEALRNFLNAQDILRRHDAHDLLFELQRELVYFYISVGRFGEAITTSMEGRETWGMMKRADSVDYHEVIFNYNYSQYSHPEMFPVIDVFEERINWTDEKGIELLHSYYTGVYRTYLIKNGHFDQLKTFYLTKYPIEFEELKNEKLPLYYRLKAYFFELDDDIDSANTYWRYTLGEFVGKDDPVRHANMHYRYAQFLVRHVRSDSAIRHLQQAIMLDEKGNDLSIQSKSLKMLEEIYFSKGLYDSAYMYQALHYQLQDSIARMNEQDKLVLAEFIFQTNVKQREQEEMMRIQDMKISGFAVGFGLFLLLSTITFYQYRKANKEKRRSDKLLLNILPESTAEELKEKGKTTALKYDNATVLFADFVGFTKWADRMTAAELVKEIDRYFSAFDDIITRHGLEKIKTIGDAYMAVGGLPEGNTANAYVVTQAARDMLKFVEEVNRRSASERPVDIRIGLHTGEVVAGVVGNKKFQFDIWGDAVNTAARMEQNGSPGMINISASTYAEIHTEFKCTYRGKIHAKNKGEMDMYYVDN